MNSDSRRLRGTGAAILVAGGIAVVINILHFQATDRTMLLLLLAGIVLPIMGLFMLITGRAPFGNSE